MGTDTFRGSWLPYHLPMIVRVLTARVKTKRAAAFNSVLRQQLPILREQPGLVYVKLARQVGPDEEEVLLFEEWRDPRRSTTGQDLAAVLRSGLGAPDTIR